MLQKKLRIQSAQEEDIKYLEASYNLLATKFYNQVPYAMPKASRRRWISSRWRSPRREAPTQSSSLTRALFAKSTRAVLSKHFMRTEFRIT